MTKEQKIEVVKGIKHERLLELLINYATDFNPIDTDKCETYEIIKEEVKRRMNFAPDGSF